MERKKFEHRSLEGEKFGEMGIGKVENGIVC